MSRLRPRHFADITPIEQIFRRVMGRNMTKAGDASFIKRVSVTSVMSGNFVAGAVILSEAEDPGIPHRSFAA